MGLNNTTNVHLKHKQNHRYKCSTKILIKSYFFIIDINKITISISKFTVSIVPYIIQESTINLDGKGPLSEDPNTLRPISHTELRLKNGSTKG